MALTNLNTNYVTGSYVDDLEYFIKISEHRNLFLSAQSGFVPSHLLVADDDGTNAFIGYGIDLKENSVSKIQAALHAANTATGLNIALSAADIQLLTNYHANQTSTNSVVNNLQLTFPDENYAVEVMRFFINERTVALSNLLGSDMPEKKGTHLFLR